MEDTQIVIPDSFDSDQIADAQQAAPDAHESARKILGQIGTGAVVIASLLLPVAGLAALVLAGVVMFTSVQHLGTNTLAVNRATATLVAASVVATLAALVVAGVVLSVMAKRRTLVLAGLFIALWLAMGVVLALLDSWLTISRIKTEANILVIGTFVYSALPALPIIPLVVLALSVSHESRDQYPTPAAAFGAVGFTMLKMALTIAMFSFEAFFGINIGVEPIAAVFAGLLNAIAFGVALGNVEAASKDNDQGGVNLWAAISAFYAVLMFAIAAEAIITFSATTGKLDALRPPDWLESFAQWAFVSSIGLSALLITFTFWRKSRRAVLLESNVIKTDVRPLSIRIADRIRGARAGIDEIKSAARGLPAPQPTMQMANYSNGAQFLQDEQDEELRKAHNVSETQQRTGAGASESKSGEE